MAFTEVTNDIEKIGPDKGGARGFTAGEDVIAGQVVKLNSDDSVQPSDTDGEETYGVVTQTVSSGDEVQVAGPGTVVRFTAGEAVSTGVITSDGGTGEEGQVADADTTGDHVLGIAFQSAGGQGDTLLGIVLPGGQIN